MSHQCNARSTLSGRDGGETSACCIRRRGTTGGMNGENAVGTKLKSREGSHKLSKTLQLPWRTMLHMWGVWTFQEELSSTHKDWKATRCLPKMQERKTPCKWVWLSDRCGRKTPSPSRKLKKEHKSSVRDVTSDGNDTGNNIADRTVIGEHQTPSAGQSLTSPATQNYCCPEHNASWQLPNWYASWMKVMQWYKQWPHGKDTIF